LPWASEAETPYVPADTNGTLKDEDISPEPSAVAPATYVAPKLMLTETPELNPDPETLTPVPADPIEELSVIDAVVWVPEEGELDGEEVEPF